MIAIEVRLVWDRVRRLALRAGCVGGEVDVRKTRGQ